MPDAKNFQETDLTAAKKPLSTYPVAGTGTTIVGQSEVWNNQDYNQKLNGQLGIAAYEEVRRDPIVSAGLARIKMPIASSIVTIKPGASEKDENGDQKPSAKDEEIAAAAQEDFIDRHYGGSYIQPIQSFADILNHILLMLDFGHSSFNVWWTVGESGRHVPEFLPILPQSVFKFELDPSTRALAAIHQWAFDLEDGTKRFFRIPSEDVCLFTWRQEGDNYWGWAALRECFKPWDLKRVLELVDAVGLEKHACGVDEFKATDDLEPGQEAKLQQALQNIRSHQRGGILSAKNVEYKLHNSPGETGCNASIERLREEILLALFCEGILMGGTAGGGNRALGDVKQEDLHIILQGITNRIKATFSRGPLRRWTIANFGPQTAYPEIEFEPLDKMGGTVLANIIKLLTDAKVLTPGAKTEAWAREMIQAPDEDEPYQDPTAPPPSPFGLGPDGKPLPPDKQGPPDGKERPGGPPQAKGKVPPAGGSGQKAALSQHGLAVPGIPFRREPFPHEGKVAFTDIRAYLDNAALRAWHRHVVPIRDGQINALAAAAAAASDAKLASGNIGQPGVKELASALQRPIMEAYKMGRKTVLEEAKRTRDGMPGPDRTARFAAGDDPYADMEAEADTTSDDDPLEAEYPAEPSKSQAVWITRIAQALAVSMTLGLAREAIRSGQMGQDQRLPEGEKFNLVRDALNNLSVPTAQADLSGKIIQAFTTGRVEQGQDMEDQIDSVFYAALLDDNCCDPCIAMDGVELDPKDYENEVPNPNCEGGDRCRCQPVFVFRENIGSDTDGGQAA